MKLNTITSGVNSAVLITALNNNFNGFNNCTLGVATITDITNSLIGADLINALNGNIEELDVVYPISKTAISIGMRGSAFNAALNSNFSNFSISVLSENEELFDRMEAVKEDIENEITNEVKNIIKETILDLRLTDIWTKADAIYFFNIHNRRSGLLNWVRDEDAWFDAGADWYPKDGISGDGVTGKINLLTSPSAFTKYLQDNAVIGYFSDTNDLTDAKHMMVSGTTGVTNMSQILIRTASIQIKINEFDKSGSYIHSNDIAGLIILERNGETDVDLYVNGVKNDINSNTSTGLPVSPFLLLGNVSSGFSKNKVSFVIVGGKLGTLNTDLFDIVTNFNTKIKLVIPDGTKRGLFKTNKPMLTLRFDDGLLGQTTWKSICDGYGIKAFMPVLTGTSGSNNYLGLAFSTIKSWYDDGWEIGSHGVDDTDLAEKTRADALADIILSKQRIESFGMVCNNFVSHKYGGSSLSVRADAMKHYRSFGWYDSGVGAGLNPQILEHSNLRCIAGDLHGDYMAENASGVLAVKGLLDTAKSENRWLIYVIHAPESQEKIDGVAEIIEYAMANDIEIVTVQQALDSCDII